MGAVVFVLLGLPLPVLLGPMLGCLIAAFAGLPLQATGGFGTFMRTFLGVAVGASITPAIVSELPQFAGSLLFVPLFIAVIGAAGYPLLRWGFGFNHPTAWYAAMPGGLQDMLVFGQEAGGDTRAMSLIHATRVLVVVTVAPMIMIGHWGVDLSRPPGVMASEIDPIQILLMTLAGLGGWKIAERFRLFGASILGPMILTAILSLTGVITHRPPAEIIWASQFFVGIAVGVNYTGITLRELRVCVVAGLAYTVVLAMISAAFIVMIHTAGLAPSMEAFLAYLPGGQAEMVVIAILSGADLAFVVSHHLLRVVVVILLSPIVEKRFRGL